MSRDKKRRLAEKLNNAINMLGDDHILCIIGNLSYGQMRFNELQRSLNINPTTLTDRLTKLEKEGIIDKEKETLDKLSVVYSLTKKGQAIFPIVKEFEIFANKFLD